jgi:hypothetical protein
MKEAFFSGLFLFGGLGFSFEISPKRLLVLMVSVDIAMPCSD